MEYVVWSSTVPELDVCTVIQYMPTPSTSGLNVHGFVKCFHGFLRFSEQNSGNLPVF